MPVQPNRNNDIPTTDVAPSTPVLTNNYPESFPIFWGPEQPFDEAGYQPPDYSKWRAFEPLSVPRVVRLIDTTTTYNFPGGIQFVQDSSASHDHSGPDFTEIVATLAASPTLDNLIVVYVVTFKNTFGAQDPTLTVTVKNDAGAALTQIGSYVRGAATVNTAQYAISVWYKVCDDATNDKVIHITATGVDRSAGLIILEYTKTDPATPFDDTNSNFDNSITFVPMSAGAVPISQNGDLVLGGFFTFAGGSGVTPASGYTNRAHLAFDPGTGDGTQDLFIVEALSKSTPSSEPTADEGGLTSVYVAIGASFKK